VDRLISCPNSGKEIISLFYVATRRSIGCDRCVCGWKKPCDVDKALVQLIRQFTSFRTTQEANREPMSISLERLP